MVVSALSPSTIVYYTFYNGGCSNRMRLVQMKAPNTSISILSVRCIRENEGLNILGDISSNARQQGQNPVGVAFKETLQNRFSIHSSSLGAKLMSIITVDVALIFFLYGLYQC
jgi:hypothetical protein